MLPRDLPCVRTARYAIARSTEWTDLGDALIADTPACRATPFGHRMILDTPPWEDFAGHYARWRAHHAGKGVRTAYLLFEQKGVQPTPEVPAGITAYTLSTMLLDPDAFAAFEPRPLPDGLVLRAVASHADWATQHALGRANHPDNPTSDAYLDWALGERRAQVEGGRARQLAVFNGEDAIAAAALVHGSADARFQDVQTHPDHRGRGLATAVVAELCAGSDGRPLWIVAGRDDPAERLYARIGFRTETTAWEFGLRAPRTAAEIEELLQAVETASLAKGSFDHVAHLHVGAAVLRASDSFDAALDRLRSTLQAFLAHLGVETTRTTGYHETITRGWLALVARELAAAEARHGVALTDPSFPFADACLELTLALGDKYLLLQHWERDTLMGWDSRRAWVEPDKAPIGAA